MGGKAGKKVNKKAGKKAPRKKYQEKEFLIAVELHKKAPPEWIPETAWITWDDEGEFCGWSKDFDEGCKMHLYIPRYEGDASLEDALEDVMEEMRGLMQEVEIDYFQPKIHVLTK